LSRGKCSMSQSLVGLGTVHLESCLRLLLKGLMVTISHDRYKKSGKTPCFCLLTLIVVLWCVIVYCFFGFPVSPFSCIFCFYFHGLNFSHYHLTGEKWKQNHKEQFFGLRMDVIFGTSDAERWYGVANKMCWRIVELCLEFAVSFQSSHCMDESFLCISV